MPELIRPGFRLLMVDDSEDDIFLVRRAFEQSGVGRSFYAVSDGQEALAYLRAEGQYANRDQYPFPNILLTDLKMPGLDGFGLLQWLGEHPECSVIPTIAFTSSFVEADVQRVYELGGNAFLTKPSDFREMVELIQTTYRFWSRCQVPQPPRNERCA